MRKGILVGVAALLAVTAMAQAGTIAPPAGGTAVFSDDFESYATSAAFKAVWVPATGSTVDLAVGGGKGGGNAAVNSGGAVAQHNIAVQTIKDDKPLVLEADMWDYSTGNSDRNTIGIRSASLFYEIGEYNSMDDGSKYPANGTTVQGYGMRIVYGGAPVGSSAQSWWAVVPTTKITSTDPAIGYHHLKVVMKGSDVTMSVKLSNGNVYTRTIATTTAANKTVDNVRIGGPSGVSSTGTSLFDNVQIYTTPEPASMLLLGLGGLLLRRRRA